ncbi:SDR family oxidoreductase [Pigmentiphaga sp.]|uniref:SDR family NAD(P)-dependent oxidoreductase n=1 Tax=Pigmentiphaga sp. TaxID=1977564 RepID=UPI0025DFE19B|nr:SDR family oxidoreductase [Pigmentiphaga sp.]
MTELPMHERTFPSSHVALVCGGRSPIGLGIAREFAARGAGRIAIAGRNEAQGRTCVDELARSLPRARFEFIAADIADDASRRAMFDQVREQFGGLDSYVHCVPPGAVSGALADAGLDRFRTSLLAGLGGLAGCCQDAAGLLRARGGGSILVFASDAGRIASPRNALVATVQSGIMALVRSLALELARDRIRVNGVSPTYVRDTPLFDRLMSSESIARRIEKAAQRAGLGLPAPDDIAPMAVFLAGNAASKITGQIISINGGLSAA